MHDEQVVNLEEGQTAVVNAPNQSDSSDQPAAAQHHLLEGKELQGAIGEFGKYEVDIDADGKVDAMASGEYAWSPVSWFAVKANLSLDVDLDAVGGVLAYAKSSSNSIVQKLAAKLSLLTGRG